MEAEWVIRVSVELGTMTVYNAYWNCIEEGRVILIELKMKLVDCDGFSILRWILLTLARISSVI